MVNQRLDNRPSLQQLRAKHAATRRVARPGGPMAAITLATMLAGCAVPKTGPVDWWHQMQGGPIAAQRPPPPGAHDPYPNLDTVPPAPSISSTSVRKGLTTSLLSERARMNKRIAEDPVPITDPMAAAKKEHGGANNPANPAPAPGAPTSTTQADMPSGATLATSSPANALPDGPGLQTPPPIKPVTIGPLPDLATAPPPPPALPGLVVPNPPAAGAAAAPAGAADLSVPFPPSSYALPPSALPALIDLAAKRNGKPILITGGGDGGQTPEAAMLGLQRAHAVWYALRAAGVPQSAMSAQFLSATQGVALRLTH